MKKTILLTRPRNASARWAALAQPRGFDSVIEPVLIITPTETPRPVQDYQAVFITSSNAPDALAEIGAPIGDILALPCYCVGTSTGAAARAIGFTDIRCGLSDSAGLARMALQTLEDKTKPLLHIAGDQTDGKLADILSTHGFTLIPWIVYHAQAVNDFSEDTSAAFARGVFDAMPVFSPRSARILVSLIEKNRLTKACSSITAIGLSQAVADVLQSLPWRQLRIAQTPSEEDMLACLESAMTQNDKTQNDKTQNAKTQNDRTMPVAPRAPVAGPKSCKRRTSCVLWAITGLIVAACLGGFAVLRCPAFQPLLAASLPASASPDEVAALQQRIGVLETQVKTLTEIPVPAPASASDTNSAALAETVKNLQAQIADLQSRNSGNQQAAQQHVGAAVTYIDLRDAAMAGRDFSVQLKTLHDAAGKDAVLGDQINKLQPYAASPPPSLTQLRASLAQEETQAPAPEDTSGDWLAQVKKMMRPLISVHALHGAQFAGLEQSLDNGDVKTALAEFNELPENNKARLSAWKAKLDARVALDDILHDMSVIFAAPVTGGAS